MDVKKIRAQHKHLWHFLTEREGILSPERVPLNTMPGDVPYQLNVLTPEGDIGTFTVWKRMTSYTSWSLC